MNTTENLIGGCLPQSKTLTRHPLNPSQLAGYSIFETALALIKRGILP
jgi:hypothetical protein